MKRNFPGIIKPLGFQQNGRPGPVFFIKGITVHSALDKQPALGAAEADPQGEQGDRRREHPLAQGRPVEPGLVGRWQLKNRIYSC